MGSWRVAYTSACVDPGIYFRVCVCVCGGGGSRPNSQKRVWTFFTVCLVLNLFYSLQRAAYGFITEKTILSKDPEGVKHFPRGSNFFHLGPNANFYRNPYNL